MSKNDRILYRTLDHAFRILNLVQNSQSTISPPLGDSANLPDIFYVDSGAGSDVNDGRDPGFPLATIDAAINKCTVSQGDVILVQPGHSETLTAQISLDVIGVSIIGIGEGTLRPYLTINAAIDGIDIGAANCRVENIGFNEATAAQTAAINIDAANAVVAKCHLDIGVNDELGVITITANGELATVEDCTAEVTANGTDEFVLLEGVVDRPIIRRNTILCGGATNVFDVAIVNADAVAVTNLTVYDNDFLGEGGVVTAVVGSGLVTPAIGPNRHSGGAASSDRIVDREWERLSVSVSFDGSNGQSTIAEHEVFTVTGRVHVKIVIIVDATLTQTDAAIQFGIAGTTDQIIAVTQEELLSIGEFWYDATPDTLVETPGNAVLERVLNGQDIGYEITTNVIDVGGLTFMLEWKPLSYGAVITAADGSAGAI
jgi:hypothetical protein